MLHRVLLPVVSLVVATIVTVAAAGDDAYAARINPLAVIEKRQGGSGCPRNAYPCPDGNGCCPNGTECTAGGHCGVSCGVADPRCGTGCCPLSWNATCDPRTFQCIVHEGPPPTTPPPVTPKPVTPKPDPTTVEPDIPEPTFVPPTTKAPTTTRGATVAGSNSTPTTGIPVPRNGAGVTHAKTAHVLAGLAAGLTWIAAF